MITSINVSGFSPNGMCIDIVEIGNASGQISSIFDRDLPVAGIFVEDNMRRYQ